MKRRKRFQYPAFEPLAEPPPPADVKQRATLLKRDRDLIMHQLAAKSKELEETRKHLELAPKIEAALQQLSHQMFAETVGALEVQLTNALQEVLEQPIQLKVRTDFKRGGATVEFYVLRDGHEEDVMRGQGGSVLNILSVGLRMFALTTLDPAQHRKFLVLDEPDGWLRPELVPRLVKIIHEAGRALGFQVILISHHEVETFERYADKIYSFEPQRDGSVKVEQHDPRLDEEASV